MNLGHILAELTGQFGQKTAVVYGDRRVSYTELDEASNQVAGALIKLGVCKGDRVVLLLTNSPEFVIYYFGIVKSGAVAVLLDPKYKVSELKALLGNAQPRVLVTENLFISPLLSVLAQFEYIKHVINLDSSYEGRFLSNEDIMNMDLPPIAGVEIVSQDIAHIAYTSGPSFQPQGVMLAHQDLLASANIHGDTFQMTGKDVAILFALPMHHAFGMVVLVLASLVKGATVVILPGLSITNLIETIARENVTIFMGVPFVYALAARTAEEEGLETGLSPLRLCVSAGAPLTSEVRERFEKSYGVTITDLWGLTESLGGVTCETLGGSGKPDSVGKAMSGYEIKIVDDGGNKLPAHQLGEVVVRGPMMRGYYLNQAGDSVGIRDGWLHTADMGKLDEDGELFLAGRKRDMIIIKGQNVFPSDIEQVLLAHPRVAEAAVVGVPDKMRGEVARAVIRLHKGETVTMPEIIHFCREHLANYKLPKQVVFVDDFPRAASGRILKEDLR